MTSEDTRDLPMMPTYSRRSQLPCDRFNSFKVSVLKKMNAGALADSSRGAQPSNILHQGTGHANEPSGAPLSITKCHKEQNISQPSI